MSRLLTLKIRIEVSEYDGDDDEKLAYDLNTCAEVFDLYLADREGNIYQRIYSVDYDRI